MLNAECRFLVGAVTTAALCTVFITGSGGGGVVGGGGGMVVLLPVLVVIPPPVVVLSLLERVDVLLEVFRTGRDVLSITSSSKDSILYGYEYK